MSYIVKNGKNFKRGTNQIKVTKTSLNEKSLLKVEDRRIVSSKKEK